MPITPQEFAERYRRATVNERGAAQSHFIDLCQLLDVPTPMEADPQGVNYRFEKPVLKTAGGSGFADVWKRGHFGWEYKGREKNLQKAYQQLLGYREDLENPPLLVVSDMQVIQIHTNFTGTQKRVITYSLDDLLNSDVRARLRLLWEAPERFNPAEETALATVAAMQSLARISVALKAAGEGAEETAHFLIRVLFTLFAEDVNLLPEATFKRLLKAALRHPEDFALMCQELFEAMKVGRVTMQGRIPYINGGVFDATHAPALDRTALTLLEDAAKRNWSQIDPTIFGTLFETVIDPDKRGELGAHYTPLADILDVVQPVIFRPLRKEWEQLRAEIQPTLLEIEQHRSATGDLFTQQAETERLTGEVAARLTVFQERLASVRILDPAMGSGNFLYVSLRLLLDLELDVRETIRAVTQNVLPPPQVRPQQLLGMEINPYAHEIAGMVLHIGYLQWLREHGETAARTPVLEALPGLLRADAVLTEGGEARPWPEAEFIVGNPPFLGYSPMRSSLGDDYVRRLRSAYEGKIPGMSDFVCYFFEQARENIEAGRSRRVGLIATNSITGGENAHVLERITRTGGIFEAWPDRAWVQDGAAVRTALVMFDDGTQQERALLHHEGDERSIEQRVTVRREVAEIHPRLRDDVDLRTAKRLEENAGKAFVGIQPTGHFDVPEEVALEWLDLPNPSGLSNRDVLFPYWIGNDITRKRNPRYTVNFFEMSEAQARQYQEPFAYIEAHVYEKRQENNNPRLAQRWWQYESRRPKLFEAIHGLSRMIVTPRVAKHRMFVFLPTNIVPDNMLVVIAADDDYTYGILNSRIHTTWALRMGTFLGVGNDPRYTPSTCFETFPFPAADEAQRTAITQAAEQLDNMRTHLLSRDDPTGRTGRKLTMTAMYNMLETYREEGTESMTGIAALARAHDALDTAVAAAYGWPWPLSEGEILQRLLAENQVRSQREQQEEEAPADPESESGDAN